MAQIPNAQNYRPLDTDDEKIIRVWYENMTARITDRINELQERLRGGETISLQPNDLGDTKFKAVMWEKHHGLLVDALKMAGWHAVAHVNPETRITYLALASVKK